MNQMQQMLMQAQRMQRELEKAHEALASKEFVIKKAGIVEVTLLGNKTVKVIKINDDAFTLDDKEMVQDTIMMAINEGLETIANEENKISENVTGKKGGFPF